MRKSHKIRPVLESLESIELLSTMPGHAAGHIAHHALSQQAPPSFQAIFPTNYAVTGVRQDTGGNVAITLTAKLSSGATQAYVYYGPLSSISNPSFLHEFSPTIPGVTSVTSSALYGPNTPMFNPSSIPANNITAVGSYVAAGSSYQHGMVYKGPVDGTGTYTPFVAPGNGKDTVGDTIAHSTMGNLIVGNFDYQSDPARLHGFIYDTSSGQPPNAENFTTVDRGRFSTTIYGIWQNGGGSSTSYTIVGGFSHVANGGRAFIENYTPALNCIDLEISSRFHSTTCQVSIRISKGSVPSPEDFPLQPRKPAYALKQWVPRTRLSQFQNIAPSARQLGCRSPRPDRPPPEIL